jgi:hypothetical protein
MGGGGGWLFGANIDNICSKKGTKKAIFVLFRHGYTNVSAHSIMIKILKTATK